MTVPPDERRDKLADAISEYASEAGAPMRFALTVEVMTTTGPMLLHRGWDIAAGTGIQPWHEIGMHRAGALLAERDLLAWTLPAGSDPDAPEPG